MARTPLAVSLVLVVLLAACQSADPRRVVAETFIDRLFVIIDQQAAKEMATGLAIEKLDEELRLKGDVGIDESTRKPQVSYRFVELRGADDAPTTSLVYDLSISPEGTDTFSRQVVLTMRRADDTWRVANYALLAPPGGD